MFCLKTYKLFYLCQHHNCSLQCIVHASQGLLDATFWFFIVTMVTENEEMKITRWGFSQSVRVRRGAKLLGNLHICICICICICIRICICSCICICIWGVSQSVSEGRGAKPLVNLPSCSPSDIPFPATTWTAWPTWHPATTWPSRICADSMTGWQGGAR